GRPLRVHRHPRPRPRRAEGRERAHRIPGAQPDRQGLRRLLRSGLPGPDLSRRPAHLRDRDLVQVVGIWPAMQALTLLHRWLAVPLAPLFAMWFASGIVMHFVPYPALSEAERTAGQTPIEIARVTHGFGEAVAAGGIAPETSVRLLQRAD